MKNWSKLKALVFSFLAISAPTEALELDDEQKNSLDDLAGQEGFAEKFMEEFNSELEAKSDNTEAQNMIREYMSASEEEGEDEGATGSESETEEEEEEEAQASTVSKNVAALIKKQNALKATNAKLKAENEKLAALPEDESLIETVKRDAMQKAVKHSKSHLFASGNSWDATTRPWNKNVVDGKINAATTWDKVNIDKLNEDLGAYSRRNANEIMSMIFDGLMIPQHWQVVSNVQDEYVFASIATGQITQAFKKAFLPKNKQRFVPQINKIFDKQIDVNWAPSELKSIEKSWLNMFFNEGSTPYKMSFVQYLVSELMKKARHEDKITIFKGVFKDNTDGETAGDFMNAMDGFLKIVNDKRGVEYNPFVLGNITPANVYEKVNEFVAKLPYDFRKLPNLKFGISDDLHKAYHDARERLKGTNMDYVANDSYVDKYPNIQFVAHPEFNGTEFMYVTTDDNVGIMVDRPGEDGVMVLERALRAINGMVDYKLGVFFKAFGAKVDPNAPLTYEDQIFFSNEAEVLTDVYYPAESNDATPSVANHYALSVGSANTSATDITDLDDATVGETIYLYGDADSNISTVKNNSNIILNGGDFELNKGNILRLKAVSGGKFVELDRYVAGQADTSQEVVLDPDATTADATEGNVFVTSANTGATALTDIENAVPGETYTIKGGSDTDSTTIASGGKFLLSAGFTASEGSYIELYYNDGLFREVARG